MAETAGKAKTRYTIEEWREEAKRRFGADPMNWRFVCPSCGHIASVQDWKAAGARQGEAAFSCVGRHLPNPAHMGAKGKGPCNYSGGGLFRLNPVTVVHEDGTEGQYFDFAEN